MADLVDRLTATRDGYKEELVWHRFLLDSYTGAGGFAGRVKPPPSDYLGWAAAVYSGGSIAQSLASGDTRDTYLDRFPREDQAKFDRRCDVAHFVNYVGPICDLLGSYLAGAPPNREGIEGSDLEGWAQDVDGRGTTWDDMLGSTIIPRALQLGWCPVLFDRDQPAQGVTTRAQERQTGARTRAVPLFPGQILAWEVDDSGKLVWVKIRLDYVEQPDPLSEPVKYTKIQIWTRENVTVYRIDENKGKRTASVIQGPTSHNLGMVPLVRFRAIPAPDDAVRGISAVGNVAVENRRHFNCLSELDEHLRSTVFALLQVPVPPKSEAPKELLTGNGNAVPVPSDATQGYEFIAPPQTVADTYENRLKAIEREIYRIASVPFDNDSGAAQSGVSRAYQFEGTNKRLVKIAAGMASAEQTGLQIVARQMGRGDKEVTAIRVTSQQDFRVDDLAVDLDNLIKAIGVEGMSATAHMLMVLRNVLKLLPNLTADQRKTIESELEANRLRMLAQAESSVDEDDSDDDSEPDDSDESDETDQQGAAA